MIGRSTSYSVLGDTAVFADELKIGGFQEVRIWQEKSYFAGNLEDYLQVALETAKIRPQYKDSFLKIVKEEATPIFQANQVYTTANFATGKKPLTR